MNIKLYRYDTTPDRTLGLLSIDGIYNCHTLEDTHQEVKIPGLTRIPKGIYPVKILEVETTLTLKYRTRYPWFTFHLEICNVPNFSGIYFHAGNTAAHTEGCILLGDTAMNRQDRIGDSVNAFERFYREVMAALRGKDYVTLSITEA